MIYRTFVYYTKKKAFGFFQQTQMIRSCILSVKGKLYGIENKQIRKKNQLKSAKKHQKTKCCMNMVHKKKKKETMNVDKVKPIGFYF
jgi:hypothetical protein